MYDRKIQNAMGTFNRGSNPGFVWGQGSRKSLGYVFHCSQVKQLKTILIHYIRALKFRNSGRLNGSCLESHGP